MVKEYKEGEVFCAVCFKPMANDDDIERGFHRHCKGRSGLTDNEMASLFCANENTRAKAKKQV